MLNTIMTFWTECGFTLLFPVSPPRHHQPASHFLPIYGMYYKTDKWLGHKQVPINF